MQRRRFLAAAAAAALPPGVRAAAATAGLIDTNVTLGDWVVRRSPTPTPAALAALLRRHGVTSAWAASIEGILHADVAGANARLAEACTRHGDGLLLPFGTVNPTLPDWEEDLRRCHEVHGMRGLRLFPGYHGYRLDDERFTRLATLAARRRLLLQIAVTLEDDRSQNPILTAAPVSPAPLIDVAARTPGAKLMLVNATSRTLAAASPLSRRLVEAGVRFEVATLEGVAGIAALLSALPDARLCFGSHAPYFVFASALLKLQESPLDPAALAAIRQGHATAALT